MNERIKKLLDSFATVGTDAIIIELQREERLILDGRLARYFTEFAGTEYFFSSLERAMVWAHMANLSAVVIGGTVTRRAA